MKAQTILASTVALAVLLVAQAGVAQPAGEIIARTDTLMSPEAFTAALSMNVERKGGKHRVYELTLHTRDDNSLVAFSAPAVEKGRQILRRGDDMWMMLPNVKRPVRVSAKQELMGGDFNNADVLRLSLVDDYDAKLVGEDSRAWSLVLKARNRSVTYDRVEARIDKQTNLPLEYAYFTQSGKKVKELHFGTVRKLEDGVARPTKWTMNNLITGRTSVVTLRGMTQSSVPGANSFTLARLGR